MGRPPSPKELMTTKQAIEQAMRGKRKPMTVAEIAEAAIPLSDLKGATPKQVIYSVPYSENKRPDGLVVRVDAETFKLNPKRRKA
jgi:HB1, ASXL, restriction endonuclease HTH domain